MSFCRDVCLPMAAKNVGQFIQLIDGQNKVISYVHGVENVHKKNCFRKLYFNIGKRTYIAVSTVRNNIENIWHVKPTKYIKTGDCVHHFDTAIPRKTRAQSTKKIRLKNPKIGNGEGIGEYSLRNAGMKVIRITGEYTEEDYCLEYPPKKVVAQSKVNRTLD